jgi:hypothetical protein
MDIVITLRDRYRLDPTVQAAADEIERLQGQVEKLEEEVYLLSSDLAYIHVKIGAKPDENS